MSVIKVGPARPSMRPWASRCSPVAGGLVKRTRSGPGLADRLNNLPKYVPAQTVRTMVRKVAGAPA
jgi:hypothetical protein